MGNGGKNSPPSWRPDAVATRAGWCHPDTGEVLKCYGGLSELQSSTVVESVRFASKSLEPGVSLKVYVGVDEKCNVTAGATMIVHSTGANNPITLTAAAQLNTSKILFEGTVPTESATLSIPAQSIVGTIHDSESRAINPAISSTLAANAGTRSVVVVLE